MSEADKAEIIGAAITEYRKNKGYGYINHIHNLNVYLGMIETYRNFPNADQTPEGRICAALVEVLDGIE